MIGKYTYPLSDIGNMLDWAEKLAIAVFLFVQLYSSTWWKYLCIPYLDRGFRPDNSKIVRIKNPAWTFWLGKIIQDPFQNEWVKGVPQLPGIIGCDQIGKHRLGYGIYCNMVTFLKKIHKANPIFRNFLISKSRQGIIPKAKRSAKNHCAAYVLNDIGKHWKA